MPDSPLVAAGAEVQPTGSAPLHTNEFFTGLWTQGNPLGPGAVPYLYQKFYSASRFDRIVGGRNAEITTRLTLARRPGSSVYNAGPFPPLNRFYEFRTFQNNAENIKILASFDPATGSIHGTVRDITGPANNITLWTKDPAAGRTSFQNVGNILYFADGVDAKQWVTSGKTWRGLTLYQPGDFIVDSNNNLQLATGAQTVNIVNIQVDNRVLPLGAGKQITLYLDPATPINAENNISLTLAGLTTIPALNGTTLSGATIVSSLQVVFQVLVGPAVTPYSTETGTATTGNGTTGAGAPVWSVIKGAVTQDGGNQWVNMGSSIQDWGFAAPANAPTVTQVDAPSIYPAWAANTWYAPLFVIIDSNNNLQKLTTAGTTGGIAPGWSLVIGGVTADNTANWTNIGPKDWAANTAYAAGAAVVVQFTYTITTTQSQSLPYPPYYALTTVQQQVTVSCLFACIVGGTSGKNPPDWTNGLGTQVNDNTAVWVNQGTPHNWPGAAQVLNLAPKIIDSNGCIQTPQQMGESGPGPAPTWATDSGSTTQDNSITWLNSGPFSKASTGAWVWAYSGKNSITGHISTASPLSQPLTVAQGKLAVVQGQGIANPEEDRIVLWRTMQGGSTLLFDDEFPNPGAGQTWIYTETNQDASSNSAANKGQINPLITAPIDNANDPPPVGFIPQCYYLGRIWGYLGNRLIYSGGPSTITGSGDASFPPLNQFTFPSSGVTCWPTSIGLICYTSGDIWVVLGKGTSSSPFYVVNFQQGVGLANQDAIAVNGSTAYGMLTSGQVVSMDPGAGEVEVGFPIGDQFDSLFTPSETYCAWHQGSSGDMALYVADGNSSYFRMAPVASPEAGNVWSPQAFIQGGVQAIASIEIAPGIKRLLFGPSAQGSPILMRDTSVYEDNGTPFDVYTDLGSIVLAQPGTTAGLQFITVEEKLFAGASRCSVSVLTDEISGTFAELLNTSNDPPNLPPSKSVLATRFWGSQGPDVVQKCRHMQVRISWAAENFANEILTYTIYGRLPEKAKR